MAEANSGNSENSTNCTRCRRPAGSGIKCSRCGKTSHKSCLKILKNVKFLDDESVICCAENSEESSNLGKRNNAMCEVNSLTHIDSVENVDRIRISYLEEIIKQKDLIILNQNIAIKSLTEQISLLKESKFVSKEVRPPANNLPQVSYKEALVSKNKTTNNGPPLVKPTTSSVPKKNPVSDRVISNAIHNAQAQNVCDKYINIESDVANQSTIRPKGKSRTRNILVGSQENSSNCPFKAAPVSSSIRTYDYHVTNLDVDTDAVVLTDYLKVLAPSATVEKLVSKNPLKYSSFKMSVAANESPNVLDTSVWPSGVIVNRFFRSKGSRVSTEQSTTSKNV